MIRKKYPVNKPELKKLLNCKSLSSSNLQVTISRVGVSVFKEDLKGKTGRLKGLLSSRKPMTFSFLFFFFIKRALTNSYV